MTAARLKQVHTWEVNDVCLVLNSLAMGAYVPAVKSKEVSGSILMSLSAVNLQTSLGFDPVDAVKFARFVQEKREEVISGGEATPEKSKPRPNSDAGARRSEKSGKPNKGANARPGLREYKSATKIIVGAGKAFAFPIPIRTGGMEVEYSFTVFDGYDINFQMLAAYDQGRRKEVLVCLERQGSDGVVKGSVKPLEPCLLFLEFDNTYSWVNPKELRYSVKIDERVLLLKAWEESFLKFSKRLQSWGHTVRVLFPHFFWYNSADHHDNTSVGWKSPFPTGNGIVEDVSAFMGEWEALRDTMMVDLNPPILNAKVAVVEAFLEHINREVVLFDLVRKSPLYHLRNALFMLSAEMGYSERRVEDISVYANRLKLVPGILKWGMLQMESQMEQQYAIETIRFLEKDHLDLSNLIVDSMAPLFGLIRSTWVTSDSTAEHRAAMLEQLERSGELASVAIREYGSWISSKIKAQPHGTVGAEELQYSGKYDFAYDFAALRDKAATRINDVLHTGVVEGNFDSVAHALTVSRVILATALSSEFDIYSGK